LIAFFEGIDNILLGTAIGCGEFALKAKRERAIICAFPPIFPVTELHGLLATQ